MAQAKSPGKGRVGRRLRRIGLVGPRGVALACVIIAIAVAGVSLFVTSRNAGVVVARNGEQDSATQEVVAGKSESEDGVVESDAGQNTESTAAQANKGDAESEQEQATVTVHVDGAVANPGVYTLSASPARAVDAVDAAGGLTSEANTVAINLAQTLEDGAKVHVPTVGEDASASQSADATASSASGSATASSASVGSSSSGKVNINTATADELTALPGVGPSTAQAIVEDRKQNGRYTSPEDLMRVSGIGEKKFAKMKDHICV